MNDYDTIEKQQKRREESDYDLCADVQMLMKTPQGRRMAWRILAHTGIWHSSFSTDNALMAFNEGKRDVGLFLMSLLLRFSADEYHTMNKEAKEWTKSKKRC